ncbi:glycosyl hydrolase [Neolewinella lacunae]|uniref:Glycosyl hydrolase n=1 Tax=Neolewinella lacunae TaxID=1517758 RepID=A0A923TAJ2_9BACT|nr:glycosyl hydrolase [Neolewinella lacunae]MBC6996238.1 glycosyl hydrolase [Neolewinella lacunae]MDN3634742.1 glycosyl hydrolase [Neolewinella lacunae]
MLRTILLVPFFLLVLALDAQSPPAAADYLAGVKMRNVGPFRGGRANAATGVVGDPLTYYMGNTGGGVWKTEDAGQHWNNISDGFFGTGSIGAIAVAESDPNIVFCGSGEHAVRGVMTSAGDGVYKSTDAGSTWKKVGLELTQHIARIVIHPKNPDIVYVAAQGSLYGPGKERGIYKSTDGGVTWRQVLYVDERSGCAELDMDPTNPLILYAAMWEYGRQPWKVISGGPGSGLYKSTDGGETWEKVEEGLPAEKGKMSVAVAPSNPQRVYALVESDSEKELGGLFVSTDAGKHWSRVSDDHRLVQRAWYYIELFVDPQNEHLVYVLSADMLRSIDGGKSWEEIAGPHGDYHDLWINPHNPKNMVLADDGGASITFNRGETWSTQSNMPTAQMYRVNVDNHFPYRIYGGQQDNTSVRLSTRSLTSGGPDQTNWEASAGGESAFLAFDPDNPRYVLGGSYLGTIDILDTEAGTNTNIMAAPIQYLALETKDMRYRYNWNAPIVWSQHSPNTYYHAAQYVLRTQDMGLTWEEISPDLTRNEKDKQGKGGGPYTNEAVGAENYGTIAYLIESPHTAGVIWTGSDDGLVHLTQDNGKTWQNVTPKGLTECLVNSIEVSPHDPATAYIATTRYKFNDHTPALYVTRNYGKTWTNISKGIPQGAFTRVVRADTERKGLLFAGTETGLYASWDDGANWESLQLNLPVVPITDLAVKHGDLVIATAGRGYWILDDLALLRQYAPATKDLHAYQPEDALLVGGYSELNGGGDGDDLLSGVNPATGIVLYYHLPAGADSSKVRLEIKDPAGKVIRTFSDEAAEGETWAGGPSAEPTLPKEEGLNRFVWDLRHASLPGVEGVYIEGSYRGHKVAPGTYQLSLYKDEDLVATEARVMPNPRLQTAAEDHAEYDRHLLKMAGELSDMHRLVNELKDLSDDLESLLKKVPRTSATETTHRQGETLLKSLQAWDATMVQRKSKAYDDVENFLNGFTADYFFLLNQSESDVPRITQASQARLQELEAVWATHRTAARTLLDREVPAFNQLLIALGIGPLMVPVGEP